jgi:hypothetical protein
MGMGNNFATFLSGAGMAGGAMGAYKSAAGQKAALNYQASVADNNAKIADQQAQFALLNGEQEEQAQRLKTAATMADQKAVAAANGVDIGSATPIELMASTKLIGDKDALTIRDNAARQAWGFQTQATGMRNEAAADRATASSMNPWMSAAGSLLTSAGGVADRWYRYRKATEGVGT